MTDASGGLRELEALALAQGGYFDRADALTHGLSDRTIYHHVRSGRFERVYPGVYRLAIAPVAPHDELQLALVWSNQRGAISHESALALYDLSDVMPGRVHLTVPPDFRRRPPPLYVLHWSRLAEDEVTEREGIRVTTPARTIVDAAAGGTDPEQVQKAIRQAVERALSTPEQLRAAAAREHYRHRRAVLPLVEGALARAAA